MTILATLVGWLLTPLSGPSDHHLPVWAAWHGRAMVLGWGILIPVGIVVARYWKIRPGRNWPRVLDDPFWWRTHLGCQIGGMVVAAAGLAIVWFSAEGDWGRAGRLHGLVGWTVMALGAVQLLSGCLRGSKGGPLVGPGDHYSMTVRRLAFEYVHKYGGHGTAALAAFAIAQGLVAADAPRWMAVVIALWWCGLLAVSAVMQRRGRCIDTYQAIWGPGSQHPGSRSRLIGVGVRRLPEGAGAADER